MAFKLAVSANTPNNKSRKNLFLGTTLENGVFIKILYKVPKTMTLY